MIDLTFLLNKCLKQEGNQKDGGGDQELLNHNHDDNNEDKGETDDESAE